MDTLKYTVFLANYLRDYLNTFSNEELRLTIFLFEVLINKAETEFSVLLDEFLNGWCEEQDHKVITTIAPTGLDESKIIKGLQEVAIKGFFTVKTLNEESSFKSWIFKSKLNNSNFYYSLNEEA